MYTTILANSFANADDLNSPRITIVIFPLLSPSLQLIFFLYIFAPVPPEPTWPFSTSFLRRRKETVMPPYYSTRSWFSNKCGAFISPSVPFSHHLAPYWYCRAFSSICSAVSIARFYNSCCRTMHRQVTAATTYQDVPIYSLMSALPRLFILYSFFPRVSIARDISSGGLQFRQVYGMQGWRNNFRYSILTWQFLHMIKRRGA